MTTRIATNKGILVVGESPDEVREKIKQTPDGFIELIGIGGDADQELKRERSGVPVTLNITDIQFFREKIDESKSEHLNPPELENRAHSN